MTIRFPAFCPQCGLIFESNAIGIAPGAQIRGLRMEGNREQCPRCGAWAELPDGTFNVVDDTIEVLSASQLTRERLLRLQVILDQARAGEVTPEAATKAIAEEAPALKPLLDRYGPRMKKALIFFLSIAIGTVLQQGVSELRDDSATKGDLRQAVEQAVHEVMRQPPERPRATSPPPPRPAGQKAKAKAKRKASEKARRQQRLK